MASIYEIITSFQINIVLLMVKTESNNKLLPKHLEIFILYANKTTLYENVSKKN